VIWLCNLKLHSRKSCRLIRLIWSPLLPFVYSILSMRSIIVTFRHLDTILLPFVYWKRYLWSRLAPPTNLVKPEQAIWSIFRTQPNSQCRWFVGQASVDFDFATRCRLRTAVTASQFMCLVCNWTHVHLATDTIAFNNYCQWTMLDLSFLVRKHHHVCSSIISATQLRPCCLL